MGTDFEKMFQEGGRQTGQGDNARCTGFLDLTRLQQLLAWKELSTLVYRVPGFDKVTAYVLV